MLYIRLLVIADTKIQHLGIRSATNLDVLIAGRSLLKKLIFGAISLLKTLRVDGTRILTLKPSIFTHLEDVDVTNTRIVCVDFRSNTKLQTINFSANQ